MRIGFWIYTFTLIILLGFGNSNLRSSNNFELNFPVNSVFPVDYFPADRNKVLLYESDFGDTELKITQESDITVFTFKANDFTYSQKFLFNDKGVFVKETYQKIKLLLLISQEGTFTYSEPLPRFKYPVIVGNEWYWKGFEYEDKNVNTLEVSGKIEDIENIKIKAGNFEALKIVTTIKSSSGTDSKLTEWFVKDLGLVKMIAEVKGGGILGTVRDLLGLGEIVFELKEIKKI
jgi:hypothetical protein